MPPKKPKPVPVITLNEEQQEAVAKVLGWQYPEEEI